MDDNAGDNLKRDKLIKELTQKIERLKKKGAVDLDEFLGFDREGEDDSETASYNNREIIRDEYESSMDLPYSRIELYSAPTFGYKDSGIKSAFRNEKQELLGILKCKITVEDMKEAGKTSTQRSKDDAGKKEAQAEAEEEKEKKAIDRFAIIDDINTQFPFNLHKDSFMKYIYDTNELKIRAYIIQCNNLSAVDSYADWKSTAAGYSAKCSANPYLELSIGSGKNERGLVKYVNASDKYMASTLNPKFRAMYPMDLVLPEDNKLTINVYSKGTIRSSLIGGTQIDLEDRYYGDAYNKAMISLKLYKEYYAQKLEKERKSGGEKNKEKERRLKRKLDDVNRLRTQLESFDNYMRKIEFRQLMQADKPQPQGTIQMWLDIFPADSRFPEYNLNSSSQNNYELRLIIWSTYNIPKSESKPVVDGYVTAIFETSNWSKEAVAKKTDTHFGSKDGHCVFNYRLKFPFQLPGDPRLKIQVFDFNTVGSNDAIGGCSILVKPLCKKLAKEGRCETEAARLFLANPHKPGENQGEVEIQMSLVTKEEAESHPVGEAQDEPNENPRLEKPTEGRGLMAYMKGSFLDPSKWSLPGFGLFTLLKYAMLMGGSFAAMAGLFVMVKFI